PLGDDPIDGTVGYPLTRFYVYTVELKAALELAVGRGLVDSSFFLGPSGIAVEFDVDRPPQVIVNASDALRPDNGRITRILVDTDHGDGYDGPVEVLFDASLGEEGAWSGAFGGAFGLH